MSMPTKGTRFTSSERAAIQQARKNNPNMSQRALARLTYEQYNTAGTPGYVLQGRSQASIYSAIRSNDRSTASATNA